MNSLRFTAISNFTQREAETEIENTGAITTYFGENVFTLDTARQFLSDEAYKSLVASTKSGNKIDRNMGNQIANGLRAWAQSKNVTHFTHWFQPLTGASAEKHDSFFTIKSDGTPIEEFDGGALIQQEPDASSFPSGGLRATFEARGYTAWDPSSPAFIMEIGNGKTLCIPTIFVSYTGESLDAKTPLLKALVAIEKAAVDVCQYFDKNVTRVTPTLGWEQEYFLVDAGLANARPDLLMTGRTVFGHAPAKGQQLEDHYFGAIPERFYAFMCDFEKESYKLGIPLRTRHNEVAPGQFECAPIYEETNLAVDHNTLLMDIMNRVAKRHNLKVLLHEKPFAGINGSGKHNNWSLATDTGVNLLAPGKTPKTNLMFLTFFINIIKAVHDYAELLRASIASAGNDHRLGANEAPPAIISIFIGKYLTDVLKEVEIRVGSNFDETDEALLKLDIHKSIPELMLDNTDRNRTSPFAFTGNRFEFRAAGSSSNCAAAMIAINAAMAHQLNEFKAAVDKLIDAGVGRDEAIFRILKENILASKAIRFEGDGYSDEWKQEAARRGLTNICHVPEALMKYNDEQARKVLLGEKVFNENELASRVEVELEKYTMKVQIESRVLGDLAINHIVPTAITYQNRLLDNLRGMKEVFSEEEFNELSHDRKELIREISRRVTEIKRLVREMIEARKTANHLSSQEEKAFSYEENVRPYFEQIRDHVDHLELEVDDEIWPLPKYRELLFSK